MTLMTLWIFYRYLWDIKAKYPTFHWDTILIYIAKRVSRSNMVSFYSFIFKHFLSLMKQCIHSRFAFTCFYPSFNVHTHNNTHFLLPAQTDMSEWFSTSWGVDTVSASLSEVLPGATHQRQGSLCGHGRSSPEMSTHCAEGKERKTPAKKEEILAPLV